MAMVNGFTTNARTNTRSRRVFGRGGVRRRTAFGVVTTLLATLVAVLNPVVAEAAGTVLFNQPFHNNTPDGLGPVVLPALPAASTTPNFACLSASGNVSTGALHSCATQTDAPGSGKLRLTDATINRTGGLFGATSVPTASGLDMTFNLYQYGNTGGADGMTLVLAAVDPANPAAPATIGQSGGGLGYTGTRTLPGLANGYLGIGFDVFGNYSTTTYQGSGCTDPAFVTASRIPGQVLVRGPGRGTVGYCGLNSTATNGSSPVVPLRANNRAGSVVPVEVVINPTTSSFTTASGLVVAAGRYMVVFRPVGASVSRVLEGPLPAVAPGLYPSPTWLNSNGIPRQLAFGWVASTGSVVDNHEVDNTNVVTFNPVPDLNVTQTSYTGPNPQPGDPVNYTVVPSVSVGANETAPVSVTATTPTGVVPVGAFGSGWVCAAPSGQTITCTNSNGPFANGTSLPPISVVAIVTGSAVTPSIIQTQSTVTASSIDANPGISTTTVVGTPPATPSGITVSPATSTIAGGVAVTVGGTNIAGATAIEIGTTAQQQAGTPVVLLPCPSGPAPGCFTVNGDGTLSISSMPARSSAATVNVTVVTRGVAAAASYVYTDVPATPAAPTATAGLANATVNWTAPASNGSPITSYIVTPIRNGVAQTPITYDTSTTSRVISGLTLGASYTFTVAAVNSIGTSATSPASNAVVPYALPGAPTITAASAGDSSARLTWTAPSTGGSPITSYVITPYIGGVAQTPQTFASAATTQTVTGLTPGTAYTFTVTARNAGGAGPPSAQSAPVIPNQSPSLTNPAPPAGQVSVPYSNQLTVNGGTAPFAWSISAGSLPPGVTINASTGLLSGTPTTAGTFDFTVRVLDASSQAATQALSIVIAPLPTLTFPPPPQGQVGIAYSDQLTVNGGTGPFVWSVSAGSLPPGVTLNASTGLLSGTPTLGGNFSFTVRVVDSFGQAATRTVALGITASPTLTFPPPPPGQVGVPYSTQLTVNGGTAPFVWSVSAGTLPPGLTLNPSTGLLSGTPTTEGSSSFTVRVVDAAGQQATAPVTLVITTGPLVVTKTSNVSTVAAGGTVNYTISVTNTATVALSGVTITDPLGGVLDDAVYNADATATSGTVSFVNPTLSWTGNLAAGAAVTISYSVTVASPPTGDLILTNTVTSPTLGTNCTAGSLDARCTATVPISALTIVKTANRTTATPGDVVSYTIAVTNTGRAAYPAATFTDAMGAVLDDAVYNNDAAATTGAVSFSSPNLTWTGILAVGASATITYTVTVRVPDPGDKAMTNTVSSGSLGSNCPAAGNDARCTATVTVLVPGLVLTNTASTANTTPNSTVGYTVTITNSGQTAYTSISVATSLAGVLGRATYNNDATTTAGALSYTSPILTWSGDLAVGATVTVTFSVTVGPATTGDPVLTSVVSSSAVGNNCAPGSVDPRCRASVTILIPGLTLLKTASVPSATPGAVVAYEIVVTNTGQSAYLGASFTDSLAGVLDDAAYNGDATATSGTVSYTNPTISWSGDLAVGASATITYSVTVSSPATGDRSMANRLVSPTPGANCATGSVDTRCSAAVAVLLPGLTLTNTPSAATATPGDTIDYTITIANTGESAYPATTSVTNPLAGVLDDAVYNGDASADSGTVGVSGSVLTWTGALAVGATVTVRFSVTVQNPDAGNRVLTSTLSSTAAGSNCPPGTPAAACTATVTVLLPGLTIVKTADSATTVPGGVVTYTITVTNSGESPYAAAQFTDSLANPLNDATFNGDATASSGTVSYASPNLSWVGALGIGAVATITYSMTILDPDPGDKSLVNRVVSSTPGSNCATGSSDARCTATVLVLVPALTITKTSSVPTTTPGATVGYTVTISNTGQTAYPTATVTDALAGVLDDAAYNNDAVASAGTVGFVSPNLIWSGSLAIGASVTITYSVTVADPVGGDLILTNRVSSTAVGSNCPTVGGSDARCTVSVPVARLVIALSAEPETVTPGGLIRVGATFTNTGQVPYLNTRVNLDFGGFIDDVLPTGDQTASSGTLTAGGGGAVWTGDIAVGQTITLTGTATVLDPDTGDRQITGRAFSSAAGNNCPPASTDPRCVFSVAVLVPGLALDVVADTATAAPGQTVGYTVTITNSGTAPYTAISVANSLASVLTDATYNGDAVTSAGVLAFAGTTLTWSGDLAVGAVVTITYSVVVRSPDPGNKIMVNTLQSTAVGSTCTPTAQAPGCTSTVLVLTPALTIAKSTTATTALPGSAVPYTLTITNSGQIDYTAASVADDLAGVLDDAAYNGDASATAGTVSYAEPVLTWTGDLAVGATVTVTYTVTVDNPALGDDVLTNVASSAAAGANCPVGGTDPRCTVTVTIVDESQLTFAKSASVASATVGSVVTYTVVVSNSGLTPYLGATFDDSLADVLGNAVYNNDAAAGGVGTISYTAPVLTWTGDVPTGGSVTITYSVTVQPVTGDNLMVNTLVSDSDGGNCAVGSVDPRCTAQVTVAQVTILNTADMATVLPGGTVVLTTTITNDGGTAYFGAVVNLGGADLLDDAVPIGDEVSSGGLVVGPAGLAWTGDLPVGGVVTIASTFLVRNPDPGDKVISATASSAIQGNNCPVGGTDPRCTVRVDVLVPALSIVKVANTPVTTPGSTVGYTITVSNTGTAPYLGAVVTDDLTGALDDASFGNPTATVGSLSYAAPTLTWTGDLLAGQSAVITYTMTVFSPDPGDKTMVNAVSSTEVGSTCPPASSNPDCSVLVPVLTPSLGITIAADRASTTPGGTAGYTISIVNTGQTAQTGVTVTNSLAGLLDDATYNGDAVASTGTVTFTSPNLQWSGSLAPGSTATITYTVTVASPDNGNRLLTSQVSSAAAGSSCVVGSTNPACTATVTVSVLSIVNTPNAPTSVPGGTVVFTTTATNTGTTPLTAIEITTNFAGSVDDATYNGDATASTGTVVLVPNTSSIRWTGDLPVGASVTITRSFTVRNPDTGNRIMTSVVTSTAPGNNCQTGGTDPACTATVTILVPALTVLKTADRASTVPGGVVGYTITVTNVGETPYNGATVTDNLAGLLDDATYNGDAVASSGVVSYAAPVLSWTGDLAIDGSVTITYTITADDPQTGGNVLVNTVSSTAAGNNCPSGGSDPACTATVQVLLPALSISKHANVGTTTPGGTVGYTITVTNSGQTDYTGATLSDSLAAVLDDATFNNDAVATGGVVSYTAPTLTWTGDLAVGGSAVITYSVAVHNPSDGDRSMTNAVTSTTPGSNCPAGGTDPGCTVTVTVLIPAFSITNVADVATTTPGSVVRFTATFTNTGPTPYVGIRVVTDASNVFDDARPNGDQVASSGTLTVVGADVTWIGDIPVGGVIVITGTVTVNNPDTGNRTLASTITTDAPGSNCSTAAPGPACTVTVAVLLPGLAIDKTADNPTITPGGTVTYTITATNTGETGYVDTTITDSLAGLLGDAVYNADATSSSGVVSYTAPVLTWRGDLPVGTAVTISYTVTVSGGQTTGRIMANTVSSDAPASNCAVGSIDPRCSVRVAILIPGLGITKTADTATVTAGGTVTYTITVTNTGQSPYTGATLADSLTGVLDDAVYNADATANSGVVSYATPVLTWTGDLPVAAVAVITYSVTVNFPDSGDRSLVNTVSSSTVGADCPGSPACTATVAVRIPELSITKTADTGTVVAGGTVRYSVLITNSGQSPYSGATVTDSLVDVLDDAVYAGDAVTTTGVLSYTAPVLTWTGDLPIGATAAITYSVAVNQPVSGDGSLVNTAASTTLGNTCPAGGGSAECTATVVVAAQSITLSGLPVGFTLTGRPQQVVGQPEAVTMTVTTNSPTGYAVTVRGLAPELVGANPENPYTIPIENLRVRESGTSVFRELSDVTPVVVHRQSGPSAPGGDAIGNDYEVSIPAVVADEYSATLEYVAITE
ncbi:beta strand repeat-containing protein [Micromonospora parathelypteridis]|uniref:Putative repeat protein (TIGR01451 family) n=1 Tax=Micromonospora parathelypteridis TaxID=1839617 RepID=A0A840VGY0_9ACTN|nr:putative Ig domain-containing protein [Micromonospora parathelypteridis]MBB5476092.1 putative repeat protein (TIGR01451 family) [Micromonospora parathelypteridis]